jgi:protein kinase A
MKKYDIIKLKQTDHIMNEIKILASINHPFIISFEGFTQDSNYIYLGIELVIGGELFTYLRGIGNFSVDQSQ